MRRRADRRCCRSRTPNRRPAAATSTSTSRSSRSRIDVRVLGAVEPAQQRPPRVRRRRAIERRGQATSAPRTASRRRAAASRAAASCRSAACARPTPTRRVPPQRCPGRACRARGRRCAAAGCDRSHSSDRGRRGWNTVALAPGADTVAGARPAWRGSGRKRHRGHGRKPEACGHARQGPSRAAIGPRAWRIHRHE